MLAAPRLTLPFALALILGGPWASCRAALILEVPDIQASPGQVGAFDVLIRNTDPTTAYRVGSHSVRLALAGVTGISFTAATIETTAAAYLYARSATLGPPPSPFSFTSFPNATFTGSDAELAAPFSRELAPGAVFGLAHVTYSVAASAPAATGTLSFLDRGGATSLADEVGNSVAFETRGGTVTIAGPAAIPEPASLILTSLGSCLMLGLVGWSARCRRGPAAG